MDVSKDLYNQYNQQLFYYLPGGITALFYGMYDKAKKKVDSENIGGSHADLVEFQKKIREIRKWTDSEKSDTTEKLKTLFPPKFPLDSTMKYLFSNQSERLAAINPESSEISVSIPSTKNVVHKIMKIVGKKIFSSEQLLISFRTKQFDVTEKKYLDVMTNAMQNAFTELAPAGEIMNNYMSNKNLSTQSSNIEDVISSDKVDDPKKLFKSETTSETQEVKSDDDETEEETDGETEEETGDEEETGESEEDENSGDDAGFEDEDEVADEK